MKLRTMEAFHALSGIVVMTLIRSSGCLVKKVKELVHEDWQS